MFCRENSKNKQIKQHSHWHNYLHPRRSTMYTLLIEDEDALQYVGHKIIKSDNHPNSTFCKQEPYKLMSLIEIKVTN